MTADRLSALFAVMWGLRAMFHRVSFRRAISSFLAESYHAKHRKWSKQGEQSVPWKRVAGLSVANQRRQKVIHEVEAISRLYWIGRIRRPVLRLLC